MIPFFRKIRKKLADDNQFFKYSRYAIGEIVLVVVGILIALQINNWNEGKKAEKKTNLLFEKTQKELLYNIKRCNIVIDFYRGKDSIIYKTLNKKLTYEDYKSNLNYYYTITSWEEVKLVDNAFNNLVDNDGELTAQQDSIVFKIKELYGTQKIGVEKWDNRMADLILDNWDKLRKEKEWYSTKYQELSEFESEYFLTDPFYLNDVKLYANYKLNHSNYILNIREEAMEIYTEISNNLDLEMDSVIVKNMIDYNHYLGVYEIGQLNYHVVMENDKIIAKLFAKNDTMILGSLSLIPESKEYFIIKETKQFGELIFDESGEVTKAVISLAPNRSEVKKIN